jgi:hypothetical protein
VQTASGVTSSGHGLALIIARWWHCQHDTSLCRTPLARMLPCHRLDRFVEASGGHPVISQAKETIPRVECVPANRWKRYPAAPINACRAATSRYLCPDDFRQAASYIDHILRGEEPADLSVQAPTKFELVVNNKTAKTMGPMISESFLNLADERLSSSGLRHGPGRHPRLLVARSPNQSGRR